MREGLDKGICLNDWRLSYRRKFLRSRWLFVLTVSVAGPLAITYPSIRREGSVLLAVVWFELAVAASAITMIYTYRKWQAEE